MNQYTLRNRFRSKRLCETSETGETHNEPPPPAAQVSYMQPLRDKLALLSHGRQNLTQANAVLMEVMLLFIATIFLIFLCRMHSSYYREARWRCPLGRRWETSGASFWRRTATSATFPMNSLTHHQIISKVWIVSCSVCNGFRQLLLGCSCCPPLLCPPLSHSTKLLLPFITSGRGQPRFYTVMPDDRTRKLRAHMTCRGRSYEKSCVKIGLVLSRIWSGFDAETWMDWGTSTWPFDLMVKLKSRRY